MADENVIETPGGDAAGQVEGKIAEAGAEQSKPDAGDGAAQEGQEAAAEKPDGQPAGDKTLLADEGEKGGEKTEEGKDGDAEKPSFDLPEGMELDQAVLDAAMPVFEELGLTHDQQQKLVTIYSEQVRAAETKRLAELQTQQQAWRKEIQKDPKYVETLADAKRALKAFGNDGFRAMVQGSWMGDNPDMIGFLAKVGATLKDDTFVEGDGGGAGGDKEMSMKDFYAKEVFKGN